MAFAIYGLDKWKATKQMRRISEFRLILIAACGGWPGAWCARLVFRHKTSKKSFIYKFYAAVAVHLLMLSAVIFYLQRFNQV